LLRGRFEKIAAFERRLRKLRRVFSADCSEL
jgi:hypothetical protein